jgi:E1A/CREB-binding protein
MNFLQALGLQSDESGPTNSATNQPSNLPNLNTVSAQPMQQSKEWHASVTPDLRNHFVHKL